MSKRITKLLVTVASAAAVSSASAMTAFAEEAAEGAANAAQQPNASLGFTPFVLMIVMFVGLYFVAIRPQKKRDQEMKEMQNSVQVGDEIVTNGGIVGIIVRTGEDTVVIETGGERNKMRIKTWAISENITAAERAKEAAPKKSESPLALGGVADDDSKKSKKKKKNSDE